MALPQVDLGNLPALIKTLVSELSKHARQGSTNAEWLDQQAMCVAEEAGEFMGAYRRWRGFARRPGNAQDVADEMADVIVSTLCMMTLWSDQVGRNSLDNDALANIIQHKLSTIFSRGWVNKGEVPLPTYGQEDASNAFGLADRERFVTGYDPATVDPEDNPNGVYTRDDNGDWTYIGQADAVDFNVMQPPFTVALGRTIARWRE